LIILIRVVARMLMKGVRLIDHTDEN